MKNNFEKNFKRLEEIVNKLEGENVSLEESLKLYEEGVKLANLCQQKLSEFEKKIEIISKKSDGSVELKPFKSSNDEPSLF